MEVKLHITEEHISKGKRYSYYQCPIALAIQDLLPHVDATVGAFMIHYWIGKHRPDLNCSYYLRPETDRWRIAFDRGETVSPAVLIVDVPDELVTEKESE